MTIILNDPIQNKSETREANPRLAGCRTDVFGVLSALGNRVDIFSGTSFFDPDKKFLQRIFLKSPYVRCSLKLDGQKVTCLGVKI
jgi:hypothetical protein